ncbi:MAG: nucleotidyltransferase domain-containing protein, partial [Acidobacteria bacterium]|nr:nucleotidyltransferase domain-containing protein [Acidobacteriota bacterium]
MLAGRQQVDGIAGSQKHLARRIRQLAPNAGYLHYADMDPGQIERSLMERLARALEPRAEIMEAYLFGSHARGNAHRRSDVDVAVYIDEARIEAGPFGYQADLTTDLMAALG